MACIRLYLPRMRIVLLKLQLMRRNHLALLVEDEKPRACGALVYGSDKGGSNHGL